MISLNSNYWLFPGDENVGQRSARGHVLRRRQEVVPHPRKAEEESLDQPIGHRSGESQHQITLNPRRRILRSVIMFHYLGLLVFFCL